MTLLQSLPQERTQHHVEHIDHALSLLAQNTQRVYRARIRRFLEVWPEAPMQRDLRTQVLRHFAELREADASVSGINQSLAALKWLAREWHEQGRITVDTMNGVLAIRPAKQAGIRSGQWLGIEQARKMVELAVGFRDRALLATLIGCGLRRQEASALGWRDVANQGRPIIRDIRGKGGRVRSVPIPKWAMVALNNWRPYAPAVRVFGISGDRIWAIVKEYGDAIGFGDLAPHDLRRTCGKLMLEGGASVEQISQTLGHASIATTQRYLGLQLETRQGRAATDLIPWGDE